MTVERVNQSFIQVTCEGGLRTIVKISAIQVAAESDPTGSDITLLIGSQLYKVVASLNELRDALQNEPSPFRVFRRAAG